MTPRVRKYEALIAPGTVLRDGLERILHGRTGALIVLGDGRKVRDLCTGGFALDVACTPTALRELAKMDGAIILSSDRERIVAAGIHLMPDAAVPTEEFGTRHRTGDRVSRQTGTAVLTVSSSMATIALFLDGVQHAVPGSEQVLARANQALAALARYRERLGEATARLTALEIQDQVTVRDLITVVQRLEMTARLQAEIARYVVQLGADGRLVDLQLQELRAGAENLADVLDKDYRDAGAGRPPLGAEVSTLPLEELLDAQTVARAAGFGPGDHLEQRLHARGLRQIHQIGRIPPSLAARLVDRFGTLQELFGARTSELLEVEGVGEQRARIIREGLSRIAENAYLGAP